MNKAMKLSVVPAALTLTACGNQGIESTTQDLSNTLNNAASAAPSIDVATGNAEVDGLIAQVNDLLKQAWNWAITSVRGLIEQVPVINQLV
jgi:hypothetical protein